MKTYFVKWNEKFFSVENLKKIKTLFLLLPKNWFLLKLDSYYSLINEYSLQNK